MNHVMGTPTEAQAKTLEQIVNKIAKVAGVTLIGNRLTVRWNDGDALLDVHMIVESVTTRADAVAAMARSVRWTSLRRKWLAIGAGTRDDIEADMYYADNGEWPK